MKTVPDSARFTPAHLQRPHPRWTDVSTRLVDFAIITYAVEPTMLARYLAPGFEPDIRTLADGRRKALVSVVPFQDRDFRFNAMPWPRFSMGQTNYRTYVLREGRPCVWFFGTSLTKPHVYAPILWWRLPWHPAVMKFDTEWSGERCHSYQLRTSAKWGPIDLELEGTEEPMGRLDGFADEEDTAVVLTHPTEGYYYRRDGHLGTYSIWHDRLQMFHARAHRLRIRLLEDLGLIGPHAEPHSILLQREVEFLVHLPPRKVRLPAT